MKKSRVMVVDDDLMSREVIVMMAEDAGFEASAFESGEAAVAALAGKSGRKAPPAGMLIDMQMPGLSGNALAAELRAACGPSTRLIAMSGTAVGPELRSGFDEFLLKPFSGDEMACLLGGAARGKAPAPNRPVPGLDAEMLSEATLLALRQTLLPAQLRALYTMSLDDVEARVATMRKASEDRDADSFRREAHSIKGGCGMVGAVKLARLAAAFEKNGMPVVHTVVPFEDFLRASGELRGMLGRVLDHL